MTPLLVVLWSIVGIFPAGLGAFVGVERLGAARRQNERAGSAEHVLGWANASAAGLMLGIAFAVLSAALSLAPIAATVGAAIGVGVVHLLASDGLRRRVVLASALHSAAEGIAIGAAAASGPAFGIFLVLTFAFHNLSEGTILGSVLSTSGWRPRAAAGAAMLARLGQPLAAGATLFAVTAAPTLQPWALGVAFGALVYLVLADLLPSSYHQVGRTSIAVVVSVAAGIVALLGGRTR